MWYDDGKLYLPGEVEPIMNVAIPFATPRMLLTQTPTVQGQTTPQTQLVETVEGQVNIDLGLTPIFIEEEK